MIHEEWIRTLQQLRPDIPVQRLLDLRAKMDLSVPDCLVQHFEELIPGLTLPDPDDRHVLAAAIHGRADVIVTYTLKDFPSDILSTFEIEAQHPDEFLVHQFHLSEESVCFAAKTIRARLQNPAKTTIEYLETLNRAELVTLTRELSRFEKLL